MPTSNESRDRAAWDDNARAWDRHVGVEGDANRRYNLDPVLRRMLGQTRGLDVLDAGCGTGYLAVRLAAAGARVTAVDYAAGMVAVARERAADAGVRVHVAQDDCQTLATVPNASQDRVVSIYVLQDLARADEALCAMARVLRPSGEAVLLFSHPCFSPPGGLTRHEDGSWTYRWQGSYFEERREVERWRGTDHATGEKFDFAAYFPFYHRPLRDYWRGMHAAGFTVLEFDEPVVAPPYPPELTPEVIRRMRANAYSVAFHLRRTS